MAQTFKPLLRTALACILATAGSAWAQGSVLLNSDQHANHQKGCLASTGSNTNGSWIYSGDGSAFRPSHFQTSQPSFPKTMGATGKSSLRWTPSAAGSQKLNTILSVFKDLCPHPLYQSHTYGVNIFDPKNHTLMSYQLHIGDAVFLFDKDNKVAPINPGAQRANMYEGLLNVYVNYSFETASETGPGRKGMRDGIALSIEMTYANTQLKPRATPPVYVVGPQDNFDAEAKAWQENVRSTSALLNLPAEHPRLQRLTVWHNPKMRGGSVQKTNYEISNMVLLSKNGQQPFVPLQRGEFFDLLDTLPLPADEKAVVQAMRRHYQNELQAPAILGEDHRTTHTGALWAYTQQPIPSQRKSIATLFTNDSKVGYSLVRGKKGFYDGMKEGEIRHMIVEWNENYRPNKNSQHGQISNDQAPTNNSDVAGNMRHALRHQLEWQTLTDLLSAP